MFDLDLLVHAVGEWSKETIHSRHVEMICPLGRRFCRIPKTYNVRLQENVFREYIPLPMKVFNVKDAIYGVI